MQNEANNINIMDVNTTLSCQWQCLLNYHTRDKINIIFYINSHLFI